MFRPDQVNRGPACDENTIDSSAWWFRQVMRGFFREVGSATVTTLPFGAWRFTGWTATPSSKGEVSPGQIP